jgi:hypothetical protein
MLQRRTHVSLPYVLVLAIHLGFLLAAFILNSPEEVLDGYIKIITSRSILVTDYIEIGGIGATLLNVAIVGIVSVSALMISKVKPSGAIIMALWVASGFAFFGKNVFNMLPLVFGVWLFSKYNKEPFSNYSLSALLVATLSPVISEIGSTGALSRPVAIITGIVTGFVAGFIFPPISTQMLRVHHGYDLYNMGFAGGLIAMILYTNAGSFGFEIIPAENWSGGNNTVLAILLYSISAAMLCCGFFAGSAKENLKGCKEMFTHSGRLVTDFFFLYGNSVYVNMGVLCAFSTTVVLLLGAQLNGVAIAGIFTIMGFGCFGKHLKNIAPVILGAVLSAALGREDLISAPTIAAILFSTSLAPVAGHFGWVWGIIAGFLHVNVSMYVGAINGGLNLYNNGFAAGFVALFLLPVINIFRKDDHTHHES